MTPAEQPLPEIAAELLQDRREFAHTVHADVPRWKRAWTRVTGICLHQTACVLGERPGRWDGVGCHMGITRRGQLIWLHDFTWGVVHGHGWNAATVGIEIDGLYEGVKGDPKTVWDDSSTAVHEHGLDLTPETIATTHAAIRWIKAEVERHGGKLGALVAHRQAIDDRRTDPGSEVWQQIALPMHAELGLTDGGPGFVLGRGMPIPEAWDPSRRGIRY